MDIHTYQATCWHDFTYIAYCKDSTATRVAAIALNAMKTDCVESLYRH